MLKLSKPTAAHVIIYIIGNPLGAKVNGSSHIWLVCSLLTRYERPFVPLSFQRQHGSVGFLWNARTRRSKNTLAGIRTTAYVRLENVLRWFVSPFVGRAVEEWRPFLFSKISIHNPNSPLDRARDPRRIFMSRARGVCLTIRDVASRENWNYYRIPGARLPTARGGAHDVCLACVPSVSSSRPAVSVARNDFAGVAPGLCEQISRRIGKTESGKRRALKTVGVCTWAAH